MLGVQIAANGAELPLLASKGVGALHVRLFAGKLPSVMVRRQGTADLHHAKQPFFPGTIRIAFLICLTAVLFLALGPRSLDIPFGGGGEADHFLAFLALSALAGLGWPSSLWQSGLGLLLLGAAIELLQGMPLIGRDMSAYDWIADAAGVSAGLISAFVSVRFLPFLKRP